MPTEGEVLSEPILTNIDCVGQDELCRVVSPKNSETPKQDIEVYKTGDYKESNYIEIDNESHGGKLNAKNLDSFNIDRRLL